MWLLSKKTKEEAIATLNAVKATFTPVDPHATLEQRLARAEHILDAVEELLDKAIATVKGD